jgi:uncharacterized protein YceH (UPF0502 family)
MERTNPLEPASVMKRIAREEAQKVRMPPSPSAQPPADLTARIEALEQKVKDLETEIGELKKKFP